MSEPIKPALTAEEWAALIERPSKVANAIEESAQTGDFHASAALALHGQPFGFSREDEQALVGAILHLEAGSEIAGELALELRSLRDRIEALLPPEK